MEIYFCREALLKDYTEIGKITTVICEKLMNPSNLHIIGWELTVEIYKSWNRYVDDIFCIVKEKHLGDSLNLLNIQDKNINFTMEIEKFDYLPFLDLRIIKNNNKLEFGIFRKILMQTTTSKPITTTLSPTNMP